MEITTGPRFLPTKNHTKKVPYAFKKAPWYCARFLLKNPTWRARWPPRAVLSHITNLTHRRRRSNRPHHRHCRRRSLRRSHRRSHRPRSNLRM